MARQLSAEELPTVIDSWPQFRGPAGDGVVGNVELPVTWNATKGNATEGIAWQTEIPGEGHSSPVHDGESVWLTMAEKDGKWLGACRLNAKTGEMEKHVVVFEPPEIELIHSLNSYASPSPVLHHGHLFVHYGTYGTACLDAESGEVIWRNTDYSVEHQGGPASSPVAFENLLILSLDGAQVQQIVALDIHTGKPVWERARSAPFRKNPVTHRAFSTPLIVESPRGPQLIAPGADQCHSLDARTGEEIWHVRYTGFSNVPRPVANRETCFICTGFYRPELWAVNLSGTGDVTDSSVVWKFDGPVPDTPSPVLMGSTICCISNKGILTALNAKTGEREWVMRVPGNYSASPISANGLLYFCSQEGIVRVVDTRRETPAIIATNRMPGPIMASPAVIGSDLLLRTDEALFRVIGSNTASESH